MAVIKLEVPHKPQQKEGPMFTDDVTDELKRIKKDFLVVAEGKLPDNEPEGFAVLGDIEDARLQRLWILVKAKAQQMESWIKPDRSPTEFSVTRNELTKLQRELTFVRQLFWLELQLIYPQLEKIDLCPFVMIKGWQIAVRYPEKDPVDDLTK